MTQREIWLSALELERGATLAEIVEAYRQLVQVWHPDRFAHNPTLQQRAQEKLKQINEAYEALKEVAIGNQILEIRAHFVTADEGSARTAGSVANRGSRRQHRRVQRRTTAAWVVAAVAAALSMVASSSLTRASRTPAFPPTAAEADDIPATEPQQVRE